MIRPVGRRIGLGIVGCGGAALDVVRAAPSTSTVKVVAVHDRDPRLAADLGARAGSRVHAELGGLLADPAVDAVYVALPHDLLVPTSRAALAAGRHVLVEKPAATTTAGIRSLRAAARSAERSVGVLFELRSGPAAITAAELVRSDAIGRVRQVRIRTLIDKPPAYWSAGPTGRVRDPWRASLERAGGGVVLMNTIHQLDLVRAITGLEVLRVGAETTAGIPGVAVEDVAAATLRFGDDAIGTIVAAAHAPGAESGETIEIDGDAGALRLGDPYAPRPVVGLFLRRPWADHPAGRWLAIEPPTGDPWTMALEAFGRAIGSGLPTRPGLDEAEAALATVLAIYRAARTARVVTVRRSFDSPPARGRPA